MFNGGRKDERMRAPRSEAGGSMPLQRGRLPAQLPPLLISVRFRAAPQKPMIYAVMSLHDEWMTTDLKITPVIWVMK